MTVTARFDFTSGSAWLVKPSAPPVFASKVEAATAYPSFAAAARAAGDAAARLEYEGWGGFTIAIIPA